jgi:hypothetical protein
MKFFLAALLCLLPQLTAAQTPTDEGIDLIVRAFEKKISAKDTVRRISFNTQDWPNDPTKFIKVERTTLPILAEASLTSHELHVLGIARTGEIFQNLGCQEILSLFNPLGGGVVESGIWCRVRLLEGSEGWLFAKPETQNNWFVSSFDLSPRTPLSEVVSGPFFGLLIAATLILAVGFIWKILHRPRPASVSDASQDTWGGAASRQSSSEQEEFPAVAPRNKISENSFWDAVGEAATIMVPEAPEHKAERHEKAFRLGAEEAKNASASDKTVHALEDFYGDLFGRTTEQQSRDKGWHSQEED